MANESSFLIEIVLKAIDQASPAINSLNRSVNGLKAQSGAKSTVDDLGRGIEDLGNRTDRTDRSLRTHRSEVAQTGRAHTALASDLEKARSSVSANTKTTDESTQAHRRLRPEINQTVAAYADFRKALDRGEVSRKDASNGLQSFGRDFRSFSRSAQSGSSDALKFGRMSDEAMRLAKSSMVGVDQGMRAIRREVSGLGSDSGSATQTMKVLANTFDDWGVKIISVSAALRGIGIALLVGLAQQLDSVVVGLAGSLVAVGSAAAVAAAGIGGALVSAAGQAIPALTVLGAAVERLKSIFSAVSAASKLQQDRFVSGAQTANQMASAAQAVTNAQDSLKLSYEGLTNAQNRLAEAQLNLVDARRQAQRQIVDLILAEDQAKLAAAGASISLQQAQQQLQQTILTGGTGTTLEAAQLQVQQAQLALQQANVQTPRASFDARTAARRGVEGAPNVVAARQGVGSARQGVAQAQTTIIRDRAALAQAERTAAAGPGAVNTAQRTLDYMLSKLDATEKAIYNRLLRLVNLFQGPNTPLSAATDAILKPFSTALDRIYGILTDPKNPVMVALTKLGVSVGGAFSKLVDQIFSNKGLQFFTTMANDASKNLPIILNSVGHLISLFQDVATAAAPVLHALVQGFNTWIGGLDRATSSSSGMTKLKDFFVSTIPYIKSFVELGGALLHLFAAIIGDAAPAGKNAIDSFTRSINQATTWVQSHGPEVRQFFNQAIQVLSTVGQLVFQIARAMVGLFDPETVATFARFLTTYLLPALADALKVLGFVVNAVMEFFNLFGAPGRIALEFLAAATASLLIFGKVLSPILRAWRTLTNLMGKLKGGGLGGPGAGAAGEMESAIKTGGTQAAEEMGTAIKTSGAQAAEEIKVAMASGGAKAGEEVGAGEVAGGKAAGAEIGAAEVAGGATAAGEIGAAEAAGGVTGVAGAAGGAAAAGGVSAGEAGAVGVGGGLLSRFLPGALTVGGAFLGMKAVHGLFPGLNPRAGTQTQGDLASQLGPVGGSHDVGGIFGFDPFGLFSIAKPNQGTKSTDELRKLQQGLKGITDPAQLGTTKLRQLHDQADRLLQMPDITQKQRRALSQLVQQLDPTNVAMKNAATTWGQTFASINTTTGNVMQQVQQTLKNDIKDISANLGTGTTQGAQALVATFYGAWASVMRNTTGAVRGTKQGLAIINGMMNSALKALGASGATIQTADILGSINQSQIPNLVSEVAAGVNAGGLAAPRARGAMESAQPGGKIIQVAEGGYDEVVLTTDPKHTVRQRALLQQYRQAAPHVFDGAYATGGYVFPYGPGLSQGRTDQGTDWVGAGDIAAIGNARVTESTTSNSGWPGGGFILYQLTDGPKAGAYVYLAENIQPEVGGGQKVRAGQIIAHARGASPWTESGWATSSGGTLAAAQGNTGDASHNNAPAGIDFTNFIMGLKHGILTGGAAAFKALKSPKVKGTRGTIAVVAQKAIDKVTKAANKFLAGIAAQQTGMPGGATAAGSPQAVGSGVAWDVTASAESLGGTGYHSNPIQPRGYSELSIPPSSHNWSGLGNLPYQTPLRIKANNRVVTTTKQDVGAGSSFNPVMGLYPQTVTDLGLSGGQFQVEIERADKHLISPMRGSRASKFGRGGFIAAADGYHGVVSEPTLFLAGERRGQSEHVNITPMQSGGWAGTLQTGAGLTDPLAHPRGSSLSGTVMDWSSIAAIGNVFQAVSSGFSALRNISAKAADFTKKFTPFVDSLLTQDTGVLDRLGAAFTVVQNALTAAAVLGGRAARIGFGLPRAASQRGGYLANIPRAFRTIGSAGVIQQVQSPETQQLDALRGTREEQQYLVGERNIVERALGQVSRRLSQARTLAKKDPSKYTGDVNKLTAEYNNLVGRAQTLTGSIAQGVTTIFQEEQTRVQDMLNKVSNVYQTQQAKIQASQSKAQALGQFGQLSGLDQTLAKSYQAQIKALQPALRQARKIGDKDLVSQIQQQIAQLQGSVTQAIAQAIQDQLSAAEQTFQTKSAFLSAAQSSAQAYGNLSSIPNLDKMIIDATTAQIGTLEQLLQKAKSEGNTGAVNQIQQEIDQLAATVAQTSAQMIQDSIAAIQQSVQTDQARVSELQSLSQTAFSQASTPAQFAAAGALGQQALQLNQTSLQGQLSSYNTLLGQALQQGNTGAVASITQTIDQLTSELAQNSAALQDNTAQVVQQTSSYIQSRGQFGTSVYGGIAQIIQTIGQTTGFTDVAALMGALTGSNQTLQGTNSGLLGQLGQLGGGASSLASMLSGANTPAQVSGILAGANIPGMESGQDAAWISAFEGIVSSLETNTEAIAQNNQQLATLNGQLLQPQQWSTSAWSSFRAAFFTGMGNLLPQFQNALPPGAAPMIAPVFTGVAGSTQPTIGELSIHHAPTTNLDPSIIGEQLAHEVSNAI